MSQVLSGEQRPTLDAPDNGSVVLFFESIVSPGTDSSSIDSTSPLQKSQRIQRDAATQTSFSDDFGLLSNGTRIARLQAVLNRHPVPHHMKAPTVSKPFGRIKMVIFNVLCIISYGHAGLDPVWASIMLEEEGDESAWVHDLEKTYQRLANLNLVAGLLLASTAAFITTEPPKLDIVNYNLRGTYLCACASFTLILGGVVVCSGQMLIAGTIRPYWAKEVLFANRFHVYWTIIMCSYPFFSVGIGTALFIIGVSAAAWSSGDYVIKGICVVVGALPFSIAILFGVSCFTASAKSRLRASA
ncbi:hypothetical protein L218DRAFT_1001539 [Marasmius fiardii PR-910]|nr:hypothetical protein L218DRAFT_1001539 [Marasmius fiardii PR-910]